MQINPISNYQYSSVYKNNASVVNKNVTQPNFGLNNPKAAMERAKTLKALYAEQGLNYLLPNEIYSTKKIEKIVNAVDLKVKKAMKSGTITPEYVKKEINKFLPRKEKNTIVPLDMKELPRYLKEDGTPIWQRWLLVKNSAGMQMDIGNNKSGIFVPFTKAASAEADDFDKLNMRSTLAHELTHALNNKFQNFATASDYHWSRLDKKHSFDLGIFNEFEAKGIYKILDSCINYQPIKKLDKNGLLKQINVNSEEDLFKKFDEVFNKITKRHFISKKNKYDTQQLYNYCKTRAHDEKVAYKTDRIMRGLCGSDKLPTDQEYTSMLYGEAEKYFARKAKNAKKAPEYDL